MSEICHICGIEANKPGASYCSAPHGQRSSLAVRTGSAPLFDREKYGKILWEAYRASLNPMLDDPPYEKEVQWEWLDHERQVAIRDAAQHLAMVLSQNNSAQP